MQTFINLSIKGARFSSLLKSTSYSTKKDLANSLSRFQVSTFLRSSAFQNQIRVMNTASKCPKISTAIDTYTDYPVPDFSSYRRRRKIQTVDVGGPPDRQPEYKHKLFTYGVLAGGSVVGMYAAKTCVHQMVSTMSITADMLALSKIEVTLADIPEGRQLAIKWRGKPLFVWHRTPHDIQLARSVDIKTLRDPERDEDRTKNPEWLVVLGVCTHLGCVPIFNSGDFGGYYCPCHGSHFDSSGRARKGPAPTNLEVPPYDFTDNGRLVVC
ncbi:uncharacterized protein [Periplaneta americana]|uniref:uncharacterized protein n=1 Tax=Periplaneta americana TaxID=6978 RepID=UPI0037E79AE1